MHRVKCHHGVYGHDFLYISRYNASDICQKFRGVQTPSSYGLDSTSLYLNVALTAVHHLYIILFYGILCSSMYMQSAVVI